MKKSLKLISILMIFAIMTSFMAISSSAAATEIIAGNTKETATRIPTFSTKYASVLSAAQENDWFKFKTIADDVYYTFSIENYNIPVSGTDESIALNLYVFDASDKLIARIPATSSSTIKLDPNADYYLKVNVGSDKADATGDYAITVSYGYDHNPNAPEPKRLTRINIDTLPIKTTYNVGEQFSASGMLVSAKYSDNSSTRITNYTVSGFDSSVAGTSVVTISYTEGGITQTETFSCTIVNNSGSDENPGGGSFFDSIAGFFSFLFSLIAKAAEWLFDKIATP